MAWLVMLCLWCVGCLASPRLPTAHIAHSSAVNQAWAHCQLQAAQAVPLRDGIISGTIQTNLERNRLARLCMQAAGYQLP